MMIEQNSRKYNFPSQLGIFFGLVGGGLILMQLFAIGIWMIGTGRPISSMATDLLDPKYYNVIMTLQVVSTFFIFFLPVYVLAKICYYKPLEFIGFKTSINSKQVLIVLGILILTFPLSGALAELNKIIPLPKVLELKFKALESMRAEQESALIDINSFPKYLVSMVVIGLLPGIFEEVCFRGGLQNILVRWFKNPWAAIILTGFLFSLIHMSYYGFLVRFSLGVILGLIFYYSKSIWLAIIFHFLYNGVQVTALYVLTVSGNKPTKDVEENFPIWAGVVALALIIYAFIKFKENSALQQINSAEPHPGDHTDFHNWVNNN